jgi:hypothetical protein
MTTEGDHLRYGLPLARDLLDRLGTDGHPTGRELADAMCIEQWRLAPGRIAPYLLEGRIGGRPISEVAVAFDPAVGWARTIDRWFVLGEADPNVRTVVSRAQLTQAVAAWIDRQLRDQSR